MENLLEQPMIDELRDFGTELDVPPSFGYWFSGLVDGEGCFMLVMSGPKKESPKFELTIHLRDDDVDTILLIHDILGVGYLYHRQNQLPRRNSMAWCCTSLLEIRRVIVPLLIRYPLRSKKARDFAIWHQAVLYVYHYRLTRADHTPSKRAYLQQARQYKRQLQQVRKYTPEPIARYYETAEQ